MIVMNKQAAIQLFLLFWRKIILIFDAIHYHIRNE